jgi:hypothetical protein
MNKLEQLIEAVEILAESKTDLAKAYEDLLEEINSEVGKFSRMDEKDISFVIRQWKDMDNSGSELDRNITFNLILSDNPHVALCKNEEYGPEGVSKMFVISAPDTETIKQLAAKLEDALDYFSAEIEKRTGENLKAKDLLLWTI